MLSSTCIRGGWRYLLPSKAPQFIDFFSPIAQPLPMPESLVGLLSGTVSGKVVSYAVWIEKGAKLDPRCVPGRG